ncbi:MAG: 1-acyl-sn-glycerol-3-phosphate acyltransferase [Clostridia bacterium]|nr:1-acyl-sn-glycerol-3-phosphate acyltransferase [Clostridia bacterium]
MKANLQEKFKNRKIKSPDPVLAKAVAFGFKQVSKKRNVVFEYSDDYLEIKDKQVVYLCQHRSSDDYIYVFAGLSNTNVHVLCGMQNVFQKYLYTLLKRLGVIAKYLYQPDMLSIKQILQAKKLGGSIMVFPEGIQSTSGSTHPINPATLKFVCKMALPVVLVKVKGSYFTKTRYSRDIKKGQITVSYSKLFDTEDFKNLSEEELYTKMFENFKYNEFEEHKNDKIEFIGEKPNIDGLDNIIYKCPCCNGENNFVVENDTMTCKNCGLKVKMDNYYNLLPVNKDLPFENVDKWYKWQRKEVKKEILDDNFSLSAKVRLNTINPTKLTKNYSLLNIGEGVITLTNKGLRYVGSRYDEKVDLFFDAKALYSLSISLAYDFDFYYKNEYFNFKLLENQKLMTKWMLATEEIHSLCDPAWADANKWVY